MTFTNNSGAVIRLPIPGAIMFPEEKVRNEVSTLRFIRESDTSASVLFHGRNQAAIRTGRLLENQRISGRLRDSWESGDFWIMYAARNNFAFDARYRQKSDERVFRAG
ncbi:hypothetical protein P175DRAFT_0533387 [Aspergillus ochraceoroseus IBT 24754]|uniref:Uncharacterized protein n=1 Tax=Aspergillus ochraceoroseus IBT 24754 TaxID=1392256 RepID=A0A2T5LVR5_9EURO|nr:uncharacterized protein P175DRAFT_0533387 [Aspergillus ochraceoroseus IBT 24754]PTU20384.1 hypothetical protein P175DRAFT_0533387 [Aspergillus ochraceoroseus IBT 24754]